MDRNLINAAVWWATKGRTYNIGPQAQRTISVSSAGGLSPMSKIKGAQSIIARLSRATTMLVLTVFVGACASATIPVATEAQISRYDERTGVIKTTKENTEDGRVRYIEKC